ncbi:hypothetical protein EDD85DRAFT_963008 [Armillaria nabsnona]|nr:hypothetical protein EDD85DRAFT_963008 [Armillaria nabsnona]
MSSPTRRQDLSGLDNPEPPSNSDGDHVSHPLAGHDHHPNNHLLRRHNATPGLSNVLQTPSPEPAAPIVRNLQVTNPDPTDPWAEPPRNPVVAAPDPEFPMEAQPWGDWVHHPKQPEDDTENDPNNPAPHYFARGLLDTNSDTDSDDSDIIIQFRQRIRIDRRHRAATDPFNAYGPDYEWLELAPIDQEIFGPERSEAWEIRRRNVDLRGALPLFPRTPMDFYLATNRGDQLHGGGIDRQIEAQITESEQFRLAADLLALANQLEERLLRDIPDDL